MTKAMNNNQMTGPALVSSHSVPEYVAKSPIASVELPWWQSMATGMYSKLQLKVWLGVVLPIFIVTIYWMLWASDRYMSESTVIIKDAGALGGEMESLSLIGSMSPSMRDALLVKEYILSWNMLSHLEKKLGLRAHYSASGIDFFSRLSQDASREDFLEYYQNYITIEFFELSSTLSIQAQAFDRNISQQIVQEIIDKSEEFINQIGNKLAKEQMAFVDTELERAKDALKNSKLALIEFQQTNNTYSPQQQSEAMMSLISSLEADIVKSEADLKEQNAYLNDDAPQLVSVRARISALQEQLAIEKQRLVGKERDGKTINTVNSQYQDLLLSIEFATDTYKTALAGLEQARIEAYQKLKHLVVVDPPVLPDSSEYPRRVYSLSTSIAIILMLYGLVVMITATIKEHRDA